MTVLERFKLELSNKQYYTDEEYQVFLQENELSPSDNYAKATMQRNLLLSVVEVLETLANDTDLMRKIDAKDFASTSEASKYLKERINDIKQKIAAIPTGEEENISNVKLFFTRR
ncbi:MAG: hypothetical protein E7211_00665 [Clostridium lundense]|nr:hypothetical protein [Clostridium lundense]